MFPEILWKRSVVASHRDASGRRIIAFQCAAENEKCVFVTPSQTLWNFFARWRLRWEIVGIICRKSHRKKWHQVLSCIIKVCFWLVFHFSTLFPYSRCWICFTENLLCFESSINLNKVCRKLFPCWPLHQAFSN